MQMETEMEIEPSNGKATILQPSTPLSRWLAEQVTILAEIFGESMTAARLKGYVASLVDLDLAQLKTAFSRASRELKFFPKIAELRELAGSDPKQQDDAEARRAWDELMAFVKKYVGNDVYGNYGPEHGWHPKTFPKLSDRLLVTVRRSGNWEAYKCMTDKTFPFVQKRFFEEFRAWAAVERVRPEGLLATAEGKEKFKQLVASKIL